MKLKGLAGVKNKLGFIGNIRKKWSTISYMSPFVSVYMCQLVQGLTEADPKPLDKRGCKKDEEEHCIFLETCGMYHQN